MQGYHYTECGLDNVMVVGLWTPADDAGEQTVTIPNINGLHRAIALGVVRKRAGLTGRELRFLRTEMGLTQAQLAEMLHREPLTVSRWERAESPIEPNAEALVRLRAAEVLSLDAKASVGEISGWCVPKASSEPLVIDGSDPTHYAVKEAA